MVEGDNDNEVVEKPDPHICNQCGGYAMDVTCFDCYDMIESGDYGYE